ncbi:MAG: AEC family transporter [Candidatus Lariskella arthropodorum]
MLNAADILLRAASLLTLSVFGFICGKMSNISPKNLLPILFYILNPVIFFRAGLNIEMSGVYLFLPVMVFCLSSLVCTIYFLVSKKLCKGKNGAKRAGLLGYASGACNSGYFGLPIASSIFEDPVVAVYIASAQGIALYEFTVGIYVLALGKCSKIRAFFHIFKLPIIYAFCFGLILNYFDLVLPEPIQNTMTNIQGAYIIMGMLLLGISLSSVKSLKFDFSFLFSVLSAKYIVFPAIGFLIVALDVFLLHIYPDEIHKMIILLFTMPPALNTVLFALLYDHHQEEAATTVLLGTVIGLLYIISIIGFAYDWIPHCKT